MKKTILLVLLLSMSVFVYAQDLITVKGIVKDGENKPVPGATIFEKGTKNAVVARQDGSYLIKVKSDAMLIFSYLGSKTVEQLVKKRTIIDVKLLDDANDLNEVVVIGYGKVQRKDLTGAVSSVKGEDLAKIPVQNVASALAGRVAGLRVVADDGTPGGTPSITLRGGGSITQSNEPLYVIDGVPQTDGLSFLDPTDIESIDVLKDASATSIYGARGSNGVILVTTKQLKSGKLTIGYDMYYGAKKANKFIPVLNSYDFTRLLYEKFGADPVKLPDLQRDFGNYSDLQSLYGNRPGINWQDVMFGDWSHTQYHKFSISGGQSETRFNLFYSRSDDQGLVQPGGSVKNVAKFNLLHNINKKMRLNAIINYSDQKITGFGTREGGDRFNALINIFQYRPISNKNSTDQDFLDLENDPTIDVNLIPLQNPRINAESQLRSSLNRTLNLNTSLEYNFANHFTYRGLVSSKISGTKAKMFNDARSIVSKRSGGPSGSLSQTDNNGFNYNNTITYDNEFNKTHKVSFLLGQEQQYSTLESFSASNSKFPSVNLGVDNIGLGTSPGVPASAAEAEDMLSFFTRANYAYKDKYIFTATLRADGSSKFGDNNKWGYFPSAAFAWRAVNESFFKNIKFLSDAKLRLSYGTAGNNRIPNYLLTSQLVNGSYPLNNNNSTTVYPNNIENKNLKWETTRSLNIGLDLGFFKQRVNLTVEAYDNRTKDLLLSAQVPYISGFASQVINIGATSNRGLEIGLNTVNIKNEAFIWSSAINMAWNKNKVLALSTNEDRRLSNSWSSQSDYLVQVGQAIGLMYGYKSNGVYQVSDFNYNPTTNIYTLKPGIPVDVNYNAQPGYLKLADLNGDGVINPADRTVIGNGIPKFTGGFNNTFTYKGFDLSVLINWSVGNDIYNANRLQMATNVSAYTNNLDYFKNRWTTIDAAGNKVNTPAALEALNAGKTIPRYDGYGTTPRFFDQVVEDGSFIRLNNVSLGYNLPKSWISKARLNNVRVYLTGYNLYVLDKYSGYDPEVSTSSAGGLTPGVDFGGYPRSRYFVAGLNISL
ncbi:TonB-dependent receptor [Pedobacter lusitanus]|uniref:TonB-dependent receptor n=1 Tax=Pedobacter lusitanus TaxID=1503925 RepID=A0A0D0GKT6_9SPHI|nr:TonB-dependent receptor [Pedobacter lusitanus]KIO75061.1 TonB-dependent receptor [Pedobacter lusitanus]